MVGIVISIAGQIAPVHPRQPTADFNWDKKPTGGMGYR